MRTMLTAVITVWTLGTLACGEAMGPGSDVIPAPTVPVVRADVVKDGLQLTNPTARTIYYTVFEHDWATQGLFLWGPCVDPVSCRSVQAGATVTIPYAAIGGYTPEAREAIVYYWELRPDGDGYQAGSIRSFVVPF